MAHKKSGIPFSHGESENEGKAWGHGQHANMPQEVHMQDAEAPKARLGQHVLNDTMSRLDGDTVSSKKGGRKGLERGMY